MFPSEPPDTWVSCVSKHFPVKREVWRQCCQVVLCCFQLNRTIYFCCRMIWCQTSLLVAGPCAWAWVEFLFEPRPSWNSHLFSDSSHVWTTLPLSQAVIWLICLSWVGGVVLQLADCNSGSTEPSLWAAVKQWNNLVSQISLALRMCCSSCRWVWSDLLMCLVC